MKKLLWILLGIVIIITLVLASIFIFKPENVEEVKEVEEGIGDNRVRHIEDIGDQEKMIMDIISGGESKENLEKVLGLLPEVDLDEIENAYGEGSVLSILEWLSQQDIEREEDIVKLIDMMDDFYRDEYFKFIKIIAKVYSRDKIVFIKALANVPDRVEDVAYALYDTDFYDKSDQDVSKDLEIIVNSKELTDKEKDLGVDLLRRYSECRT